MQLPTCSAPPSVGTTGTYLAFPSNCSLTERALKLMLWREQVESRLSILAWSALPAACTQALSQGLQQATTCPVP